MNSYLKASTFHPLLQGTTGNPVMTFLFVNVVDCLAFSLFVYLFIAFRDHTRRKGLSYPPGPPSMPIIGNLLDVPKEAPWVAYADLSKKYGMAIILITDTYPN
jgi:hypothetical protein